VPPVEEEPAMPGYVQMGLGVGEIEASGAETDWVEGAES